MYYKRFLVGFRIQMEPERYDLVSCTDRKERLFGKNVIENNGVCPRVRLYERINVCKNKHTFVYMSDC